MHYNRQPYKGDDTSGWRDKNWFENHIWNSILHFFPDEVGSVLDVGCGNGRFTPYLDTIAERVVAIDPVETIHSSYLKNVSEFSQKHFHELKVTETFDAVFFFASFMIISEQNQCHIREKCKKLLNEGGLVVIYIDARDLNHVSDNFPTYEVVKTSDPKTCVVVVRYEYL